MERNRAKAIALLELCDSLERYGPRQISAKELTKLLGNQCKPLGAYLRLGLIQFGYYSVENHQSYSYRPNKEFCKRLRAELGLTSDTRLTPAPKSDKVFVPCRREYQGTRKGFRLYPWWSYMNSQEKKDRFLAQFDKYFDYDIEVARPTILLQMYEKKCNPFLLGNSNKHKLNTWRLMVEDRTTFRQKIADDVGATYEEIKDVLQSVTNGGYVSTSPCNSACKKLGSISAYKLKNHELYIGLREDFKTMRGVLFPNVSAADVKKAMWALYERTEDKVMSLVDSELAKMGVDAWFIHDGFFTHTEVDVKALEKSIQSKINLSLKIERKEHLKGKGEAL